MSCIIHHRGRCCCRGEETTSRNKAGRWSPWSHTCIGYIDRRGGYRTRGVCGGAWYSGYIQPTEYPDVWHAWHSNGTTAECTSVPGEHTGIHMHCHTSMYASASRSTIALHIHISVCTAVSISPLITSRVYALYVVQPRWWMRRRTVSSSTPRQRASDRRRVVARWTPGRCASRAVHSTG